MSEIKNRHLRKEAMKVYLTALKDGHITRAERCEDCGGIDDHHALHGHHTDYSNPLQVVWLCSACHGKRHKRPLRHYKNIQGWTPTVEHYPCLCGCGETVTFQGIGRRPKYVSDSHRMRHKRAG